LTLEKAEYTGGKKRVSLAGAKRFIMPKQAILRQTVKKIQHDLRGEAFAGKNEITHFSALVSNLQAWNIPEAEKQAKELCSTYETDFDDGKNLFFNVMVNQTLLIEMVNRHIDILEDIFHHCGPHNQRDPEVQTILHDLKELRDKFRLENLEEKKDINYTGRLHAQWKDQGDEEVNRLRRGVFDLHESIKGSLVNQTVETRRRSGIPLDGKRHEETLFIGQIQFQAVILLSDPPKAERVENDKVWFTNLPEIEEELSEFFRNAAGGKPYSVAKSGEFYSIKIDLNFLNNSLERGIYVFKRISGKLTLTPAA
jgi:hypothetical protein